MTPTAAPETFAGWLRSGSRRWRLISTGSEADVRRELDRQTAGLRSADSYIGPAAVNPNDRRPARASRRP